MEHMLEEANGGRTANRNLGTLFLKLAWEKHILAAFETSVGFEPVSLILTSFFFI